MAKRATPTKKIVEAYVRGVRTGEIVTGKLARRAVRRHVRDLKQAGKRGLYFDETAAGRAVEFFGFLKHSKGEWAGKPFVLAAWQTFIVWVLFGWKRSSDGMRRFRTAYIEVARKNGKSTFAAALGLYLLVADGEPGAEIYTAATKREQARIIHGEATRMVNKSPDLQELIEIYKDNLNVPAADCKYEPLGGESMGEWGLNPHGVLVDELHAHPNGELWDALDTAMGARRQPLLLAISTAGYDKTTICWEIHDRCLKALEAASESDAGFDDTLFALIAALDEGDDWSDEANWIKANPNLGLSVKLDNLRVQCNKAQTSPRFQNTFRRLHLNEWTERESRWLDMEVWRRSPGVIVRSELYRCECCGGLDLASRLDLTALVLAFRIDGAIKLKPKFWIPEETAAQREREDRVPYRHWVQQGLVEMTPGNVVDYNYIEQAIQRDDEEFLIRQIAFDPWNAQQTATNLKNYGIEMLEFPQTIRHYNEPTLEFERLLQLGRLHHGNHPVLNWNAANVTVITDSSGNVRPVKPKHQDPKRVDGIQAAIMALWGWLGEDQESVYDAGELFVL